MAKLFEGEGNILMAYVFGSQARGLPTPQSDFDIAVLLSETPHRLLDYYLCLLNKLTDALGDNVDLVILNVSPPLLKYLVIKDGKPIYIRDEGARVAFEARAIDEYLDFSMSLKRYDECLVGKIQA